MNRRGFLKRIGVGLAGIGVLTKVPKKEIQEISPFPKKEEQQVHPRNSLVDLLEQRKGKIIFDTTSVSPIGIAMENTPKGDEGWFWVGGVNPYQVGNKGRMTATEATAIWLK